MTTPINDAMRAGPPQRLDAALGTTKGGDHES